MTTSEIDAGREELVRRRLEQGRAVRRSAIPTADRTRPVPLSYGQQQMWFLNRLDPGSAEYLVPLALRIKGALDVDALRGSWRQVLQRHEVLRTRYELVDDEPRQVVDDLVDVDLPVHDVHGNPVEVLEYVERAARTGFDLEREWPVRAGLVRVADDVHVLVVVFHHIAWDAWSVGVFADELREGYRAAVTGEATAVTAPGLQFADYAAWERERSSIAHRRHLDYWAKQLADLEPVDLPLDRPRPAVRDWRGEVVDADVPDSLADRVRALARRHDVTEYVVLLAAFQVLLSRYTGRTDIAVGTVVSGRDRPELQRLIGYGVNSLVLRGRWQGDTTFAGLLADTRTAVYEAFDHQEVPFARLVDELQPQRDLTRTPLFQVAFTLHEAQDDLFDLPGLDVQPLDLASQVSRFDLTALVKQARDGSLRLQLEFATALFDRGSVERLSGHYLALLDALADAPDEPLSVLEFVSARERALLAAPAVHEGFAVDRGVHALFAERAALAPDAPAVVFDDVVLSYGELNARANRLARYLVAVGVRPGSLVGVCLPRSADLVVSLLAVLKTGAAYLPLDPAVPVDRLAFMVGDADVSVVLSDTATVPVVSRFFSGSLVVLD
ncbi:condensation domain-containing protein, partial [Actinosynnema sp. NPDC023658]|uniref:condensation domain-containing protein n=1 Tax=Actinosynnema sp. NPDC023658 TaxID=3155465 RepID=UPI0033E09FDB